MDLNTFFQENRRVALAFSGGVDSAYLLYAAIQSGADVKAYYAKTAFQPDFEYQDALRLAGELGDIAWYLAEAATALGLPLEDILRANIEKLKRRYPQGFSASRSLCRDAEDP